VSKPFNEHVKRIPIVNDSHKDIKGNFSNKEMESGESSMERYFSFFFTCDPYNWQRFLSSRRDSKVTPTRQFLSKPCPTEYKVFVLSCTALLSPSYDGIDTIGFLGTCIILTFINVALTALIAVTENMVTFKLQALFRFRESN
jgi:hypothetical protein